LLVNYVQYEGIGPQKADAWKRLMQTDPSAMLRADHYVAPSELVSAVNVALTLGQPMLLTGEPGTGKTQLAYHVAWELGFGDVLRFDTKSNTESRDLLYTFDTIARFHAAQSGTEMDSRRYLRFNALGRAILLASTPADVGDLLSDSDVDTPRRSVVLIDEVDKAPRDVPNDILSELETMSFRVPELGQREFRAASHLRPVVFLTSNSEKALPDAFLRRCVYYNIPFPSHEILERIVAARLGARYRQGHRLLRDALELFSLLREPGLNLRKPPATAELLAWLSLLLSSESDPDRPLQEHPQFQVSFSTLLLKNVDDYMRAAELLSRWEAMRK
jgi:MoxR-like ATPase